MSANLCRVKRIDPPSPEQQLQLKVLEPQRFSVHDSNSPDLSTAEFSIHEAFIMDNTLVVDTRYGGATTAEFTVHVNEMAMESYPPKVKLHLVRKDTGDMRERLNEHVLRIKLDDALFTAPCTILLHIGSDVSEKTVSRS